MNFSKLAIGWGLGLLFLSPPLYAHDASIDGDFDGVVDWEDYCPNTPAGKTVWTLDSVKAHRGSPQWVGCSEGERRANDTFEPPSKNVVLERMASASNTVEYNGLGQLVSNLTRSFQDMARASTKPRAVVYRKIGALLEKMSGIVNPVTDLCRTQLIVNLAVPLIEGHTSRAFRDSIDQAKRLSLLLKKTIGQRCDSYPSDRWAVRTELNLLQAGWEAIGVVGFPEEDLEMVADIRTKIGVAIAGLENSPSLNAIEDLVVTLQSEKAQALLESFYQNESISGIAVMAESLKERLKSVVREGRPIRKEDSLQMGPTIGVILPVELVNAARLPIVKSPRIGGDNHRFLGPDGPRLLSIHLASSLEAMAKASPKFRALVYRRASDLAKSIPNNPGAEGTIEALCYHKLLLDRLDPILNTQTATVFGKVIQKSTALTSMIKKAVGNSCEVLGISATQWSVKAELRMMQAGWESLGVNGVTEKDLALVTDINAKIAITLSAVGSSDFKKALTDLLTTLENGKEVVESFHRSELMIGPALMIETSQEVLKRFLDEGARITAAKSAGTSLSLPVALVDAARFPIGSLALRGVLLGESSRERPRGFPEFKDVSTIDIFLSPHSNIYLHELGKEEAIKRNARQQFEKTFSERWSDGFAQNLRSFLEYDVKVKVGDIHTDRLGGNITTLSFPRNRMDSVLVGHYPHEYYRGSGPKPKYEWKDYGRPTIGYQVSETWHFSASLVIDNAELRLQEGIESPIEGTAFPFSEDSGDTVAARTAYTSALNSYSANCEKWRDMIRKKYQNSQTHLLIYAESCLAISIPKVEVTVYRDVITGVGFMFKPVQYTSRVPSVSSVQYIHSSPRVWVLSRERKGEKREE
ncbi:MAG: hypothetical protein HYR96_09645 [Deltaproteobacteria bacterium]|nr:hypothetical protein [Deltaproteobacteria bacterium]